MNELTKAIDALNRIAHSHEQLLIRMARMEADLDNINQTLRARCYK